MAADWARKLLRRVRRRFAPPWQTAQRHVHELRMLVLEVTQRCNLACRHCGSDCTRSATQPDLPVEDALRVLEEVRAAWKPGRTTVMIGGGEPLLYPKLWELCGKARAMGFPWGMVTNGTLWDDAAFEACYAARPSSLSVSIDGPPAEHDAFRGKKGSQEAAVAMARRLIADRRVKYVDLITCVHPGNLGVLDETFALMRSLGAPGWRLIPVSPIGRARNDPALLLDREGFRTMLAKIAEYRRIDALPVYLSESNYVGPALEPYVRDMEFFCRAGINIGGVMVDGAILACANIDRRFAQGNIRSDSFVDAWENRFQPFRDRSWMRRGPCADCREWKHCLGNSFHNWDRDAGCPSLCQFRAFDLAGMPLPGPLPPERVPGPRILRRVRPRG